MKYKIGDIVKIRDDLTVGKKYNMDGCETGDIVVSDMLNLSGKTVTIVFVSEDENPCYYVNDSIYCWTDEMFE